MYDLGNCKNSVGLKPIAVRLSANSLRCSFSGARSQALPGNVFRGGSATYELNRRQSRQEHVPRQSLGTSTMYDLGNCKNSVGLKPNAELRKDAKAPSIPKSILSINCLFISTLMKDIVLPIQCL